MKTIKLVLVDEYNHDMEKVVSRVFNSEDHEEEFIQLMNNSRRHAFIVFGVIEGPYAHKKCLTDVMNKIANSNNSHNDRCRQVMSLYCSTKYILKGIEMYEQGK